MRYYLDTEFNGLGGDLISLALIREDGESGYWIVPCPAPIPWVAENVLPVLYSNVPDAINTTSETLPIDIAQFLNGDNKPVIIADWPDDIAYLCKALINGSLYWDFPGGPMFGLPTMAFEAARVDAYPNDIEGCVQHNAWWDAMALREKLQGSSQ